MNSTISSRVILFYWDVIECIERNGPITGYRVRFQQEGNAVIIPRLVMDRIFNASGLIPGTRYTFQVAGVTTTGMGPYTEVLYVKTHEESTYGFIFNFARTIPCLG